MKYVKYVALPAQVGDAFVLNCLPEEGFEPIMKHFLKRFAPGADRFQGVNWAPAAMSGAPILREAVAYMECRVASRMEAADHWVARAPRARTRASARRAA